MVCYYYYYYFLFIWKQEARTNYRTFRDLIWNLVFKRNFNQLEKARFVL
jgi:hypothetical protein